FVSLVLIMLNFANIFYQIIWVQPGIEQWQRDFFAKMGAGSAPPPTMGSSVGNAISAGFGLLMYIAYPVALLIVMLLPTVGRAFAGQRDLPPEPDDFGQGWSGSSSGPSDPHIRPQRF